MPGKGLEGSIRNRLQRIATLFKERQRKNGLSSRKKQRRKRGRRRRRFHKRKGGRPGARTSEEICFGMGREGKKCLLKELGPERLAIRGGAQERGLTSPRKEAQGRREGDKIKTRTNALGGSLKLSFGGSWGGRQAVGGKKSACKKGDVGGRRPDAKKSKE